MGEAVLAPASMVQGYVVDLNLLLLYIYLSIYLSINLQVGEAVLAPAAMVQGDVADLNLLVKPTQNGKQTTISYYNFLHVTQVSGGAYVQSALY